MIINHNMNAMTAHRQMGINTGNQGKAIEKLSSGQKINRAGDDAAGLAISEKMRGQIRGLEGASTNAQDGVSLIQTAEGALNETHNILQRMRELSVQGANDTNVAEDRDAITKEMDALMEEIDRISTDTEFNGQKLLNGDFTDKKLQIGANTNQSVGLDIGNMNSENILEAGFESKVATTVISTSGAVTGEDASTPATNSGQVLTAGDHTISRDEDGKLQVLDKDGKVNTTVEISENKDGNITITKKVAGTPADSKEITIAAGAIGEIKNGESVKLTTNATNLNVGITKDSKIGVEGATSVAWDQAAGNLTITGGDLAGTYKAEYSEGKLVGFADATDKTKFISAKDSGITEEDLKANFTVTGTGEKGKAVDVSTHESATKSIEVIDNAINAVSSQRADLGALQNRLEHTIATNDNSAENLQAAESRIRDVDMAKEMMNLSKNNVLVQAAQSMLGQANQQPNQVLSLLR